MTIQLASRFLLLGTMFTSCIVSITKAEEPADTKQTENPSLSTPGTQNEKDSGEVSMSWGGMGMGMITDPEERRHHHEMMMEQHKKMMTMDPDQMKRHEKLMREHREKVMNMDPEGRNPQQVDTMQKQKNTTENSQDENAQKPTQAAP